MKGGAGEHVVPICTVEAVGEGLSGLQRPHLGPPGDGLAALQLLTVERQQVDEVVD